MMQNIKQLLKDLEARRDIAFMDAKESRTRGEAYEVVAIMLRNAIEADSKPAPEGKGEKG